MDFPMLIEDAARENLPNVSARNSAATISDTELYIHLGELFELRVDLAQVAGAREIEDPRPTVYLPVGVSAAVERFDEQTLSVIGSLDGLVMVDFTEAVDAQKIVPDHPDTAGDSGPRQIEVRHLILSMKDPQGFIEALIQKIPSDAQPVGSTASSSA